MAITDINISEQLETNAPSIRYRGNEGPKSPQEMEKMIMAQLEEEYLKYVNEMIEMGQEPMSLQQFIEQAMAEGQMSKGPVLPNDPTEPVNPWTPKPQGPTLPNRQMAAYGGIMGLDGRKQYGVGSWWQEKVMDPLKVFTLGLPPEYDEDGNLKKAKDYTAIKEASQRRVDEEDRQHGKNYENPIDTFLKGKREDPNDPDSKRTGGQAKNILPIIGGAIAGLFTKGTDPDNPGLPDDQTALALDDLKKSANILDQKQAMGAGLNFTPAVSARKYTPQEMIEVYETAANGGRIGRAEGGIMDLGGMEKDYRAEGGFVPIGAKEKADDVPARLSVNEFVFTADAVRNAGGGDIDKGAEVMENVMKHLEGGGQISEESQGLGGARDMFATSQRLGDVI